MFVVDEALEKYDKIQAAESANTREHEGYAERCTNNAKRLAPFLYGKVLNIGCGDGLETEALIGEGKVVKGVDLSDEKVKVAQQHGVDAVRGRMEALPFKDKEFACVYCAHTLEHAFDIERAIAEMWRVADRLVIIVPIESEGSDNAAHTSPMWGPGYLKAKVGGKVMHEERLKTIEDEYVLVVNAD